MMSETPVRHSITVESTPSAVIEVSREILSEAEAHNFSQEDIFSVRIALEEAFINAVKHGNKMDPSKEVKIDYSVNPEKIEITITDEGGGFNPNSIPDPRSGKNLYKSEGRGLLLMHSYMDIVEYNGCGNSVSMVRYKEKPRLTRSKSQPQV